MVIISLLAIELKATSSGNPTSDFYWRQKSSSLNVVQCTYLSEVQSKYQTSSNQLHLTQRVIL